MKQSKLKHFFSHREFSKDKALINAIVTSNLGYRPHRKSLLKHFRSWLIFYALVILVATVISLVVLAFNNQTIGANQLTFNTIETFTFFVLLFDLLLRWYTIKVRVKIGNSAYLVFPFMLTNVILIISLLPSLVIFDINPDFFSTLKFLRVFRIILLTNMISGFEIFKRVLLKERKILYIILVIDIITIFSFALVIFNIEVNSKTQSVSLVTNGINSFWDALYFSTITLTTIGFGDKVPLSDLGKGVTVVMAMVGIVVLTIPSGVIVGGFVNEFKNMSKAHEHKSGSLLKNLIFSRRKHEKTTLSQELDGVPIEALAQFEDYHDFHAHNDDNHPQKLSELDLEIAPNKKDETRK